MANFQPVSDTRYAGKFWKKPENYAYARAEALWPVSIAELVKVLPSYPLVFIKQGEHFVPVIMTSLESGKNMYITPEGAWPHGYIPQLCRSYPFRVFPSDQEGQMALCFDEDSGLLSEQGIPFFSPDGQANPRLSEMAQEIGQHMQAMALTGEACRKLAEVGLIVPWQLVVQLGSGERRIEGLYKIDEAAFHKLGADELLALRDSGALHVAYAHLFSLVHMQFLCQLMEASKKAEEAVAAAISAGTAPVSAAAGKELQLDKPPIPGATLDFSGFR